MRTAVITAALALFLAGCAQQQPSAPHERNPPGDIPDNQVFVPYSPDGHAFTVSVPEGWARTNDGTAVTFTDKLTSVRVETAARSQAPTVDSVTAEELPLFPDSTVKAVPRTAGQALLITFEQQSPPDPVTGNVVTESVERYEFWRGGTEVILTLSGPKGADNVDPWLKVTDSLRWS